MIVVVFIRRMDGRTNDGLDGWMGAIVVVMIEEKMVDGWMMTHHNSPSVSGELINHDGGITKQEGPLAVVVVVAYYHHLYFTFAVLLQNPLLYIC